MCEVTTGCFCLDVVGVGWTGLTHSAREHLYSYDVGLTPVVLLESLRPASSVEFIDLSTAHNLTN